MPSIRKNAIEGIIHYPIFNYSLLYKQSYLESNQDHNVQSIVYSPLYDRTKLVLLLWFIFHHKHYKNLVLLTGIEPASTDRKSVILAIRRREHGVKKLSQWEVPDWLILRSSRKSRTDNLENRYSIQLSYKAITCRSIGIRTLTKKFWRPLDTAYAYSYFFYN